MRVEVAFAATVIKTSLFAGRPHHALGMRPPVPETFLVNHQINGTDQRGYTVVSPPWRGGGRPVAKHRAHA
jgi:hypothetical protein